MLLHWTIKEESIVLVQTGKIFLEMVNFGYKT